MIDITYGGNAADKTAVALGYFDGLHLGHVGVIGAAMAQKGLHSAVFTFNCDTTLPKFRRQEDIISFENKAELVLCSYCLNELSQSGRKAAVNRLWESTERLLLIVEPGTPEGYANILSAREQLLCSDLPISTIAHNCGFGSSSHFCTLFRQREGVSPREYRQRETAPRDGLGGTEQRG